MDQRGFQASQVGRLAAGVGAVLSALLLLGCTDRPQGAGAQAVPSNWQLRAEDFCGTRQPMYCAPIPALTPAATAALSSTATAALSSTAIAGLGQEATPVLSLDPEGPFSDLGVTKDGKRLRMVPLEQVVAATRYQPFSSCFAASDDGIALPRVIDCEAADEYVRFETQITCSCRPDGQAPIFQKSPLTQAVAALRN